MHRNWATKTQQDEKGLKELLYRNKEMLDILKLMCYTEIEEQEKLRRKCPEYDQSSWAIRQADLNGYIRCLYDLQQLFDLKDE